MCGLAFFCLLLLQTQVHGFKILTTKSITHEEITLKAILNVTAQACRSLALAEGRDFTFPPEPFTATSVATACEAPKSVKNFLYTIGFIQFFNGKTDVLHPLESKYHFDNEAFTEGKKIITDGLDIIGDYIKKKDSFFGPIVRARINLGGILHPLQDFYSHSNWVELGNKLPNSNLITDKAIGNIAAGTKRTCRSCDGDDCRNNILEDIIRDKILTSGYFSLNPFFSGKPPGKCSHGDFLDLTRNTEPIGGINKDTFTSSHGHLHQDAANVAVAATSELLEEIRQAAGDNPFLNLMGLRRGKPLCFVVDTTGSMGDDIAAVKTVTSSIIDKKLGTEDEPSVYILVPFNDPDFGPLIQTTDPDVFKRHINSLFPDGGGDAPEMSLSGLQLALTGGPPNSEIFLFTDAPAKDAYLRDTVIALIEQTKSVVNFMITNVLGFRRRRQADNNQQQQGRQMLRSDAQLYRDLAQASGGQAIEVTKGQLLEAISIITESTSSSLVTLLQANRSPGRAENFTFTVDESVSNLTIYITGSFVSFTLINPSGVPQILANITGSSIISSESVGNFQTLRLQTQVGVWEMRMTSTNPYSLKVVGESPIDFLFDFLKELQGPVEGFDLVENRPAAGGNGSLMVTLTESDTATVTEVTLVESSGSGQVNGRVEAQGGGKFLVRFDRIPSAEFVVLIKGQNNNSTSRSSSALFQRQSSTSLKASTLSVTADDTANVLHPGETLSVSFSVITTGAGGTFSIQATNDQSFDSTSPSTLALESGGSANGTVNLTAPSNSPSGTGVTLTIQATAPGSTDTNYAVLRLTVLAAVTDFTKPVCQLLSLQSNCSDSCSQSMWELHVQVTDGVNGTGIDRIALREGNGTLNTSAAANSNTTLVTYTASCCSPDVQLLVVDGVGNKETCSFTVRANAVTTSSPQTPTQTPTQTQTAATTSVSTRALPSVLLCISITVLGLSLSTKMEIN